MFLPRIAYNLIRSDVTREDVVEPKPAHLGREYAAQFEDVSIAETYSTRPPYPDALFDALVELMPDGDRAVLDLGCGPGDVALSLAGRVGQVDAVDPSAAMLAVARSRPGADHPAIQWFLQSAEEFEFRGPYSIVVAAESVHWMDWEVVFPKIVAALRPDAFLAIAGGRGLIDVPWADGLMELISSHSTNREYERYDIVAELDRRGLFREVGRHATAPRPFEQTVDDYVESFHTRNGFSRERMTAEGANSFDGALRALVRPHCPGGIVRGDIRGIVIWGIPAAGE